MVVAKIQETIMQYMLMIYGDESGQSAASEADRGQVYAAYDAYTAALRAAGAYVGGNPLQATSTASVVRVKDGKTRVQNGPYAESREQLAGYYIVEAKDLDAAIGWAAKCPGASHGAIEVRPIMPM